MWFRTIQLVHDKAAVAIGRLRATLLRFRGAKIGPKAIIAKAVKVDNPMLISAGLRLKIESNVYLKLVADDAKLSFGDFVFIGKGVEFDVQEEVHIGSNVLFAPGSFITDHNHGIAANQLIKQQACVSHKVTINDDVWIGANAVILPGVTLSKGAVIAAGAVVTKSVDAMTIVAGVPATVIGKRQ
jgi:maltose O-acetyltransferase